MAFSRSYVMPLIGMLINIINMFMYIISRIFPSFLDKTDLLNMSSTVSSRSKVDMAGMAEKFFDSHFKRWQ